MFDDPEDVLPELEDELLTEEYGEEEYEEDEDGTVSVHRPGAPQIDWDEDVDREPDAAFQANPDAGARKKLLVVLLDIVVVWLLLRWWLGW